jgi:hypothetical protein
VRAALAALLLLGACAPSIVERSRSDEVRGLASRRPRSHRFRVLAASAPVEIRRDLTQKEISRLPGAAGRGLKTQGLTTIKHSLATHTRFSTATGDSAVYAWFDDVILEVSVSSIVIHIPKEYEPGSCEYAIVLEHERLHGRAAREQAVRLGSDLERALMAAPDLPTRFEPVIAANYDTAAAKLKAAVSAIVDPVYARYEKDELEAQAALDRPDPYEAVYQKCRDWK